MSSYMALRGKISVCSVSTVLSTLYLKMNLVTAFITADKKNSLRS